MADLSGPPSIPQHSRRDMVPYVSSGGGGRDLHSSRTPTPTPSDFRCYSASYVYSYRTPPMEPQQQQQQQQQPNKGSSSFRGGFCLSDPELQRKKRVATYKAYSMEGKMKNSVKKSFRWVKDKYINLRYGFW